MNNKSFAFVEHERHVTTRRNLKLRGNLINLFDPLSLWSDENKKFDR